MDNASPATGRGEFPADRPLEALKGDHKLVRQLFERYFAATTAEDKKDIGPHILLLLDMHASLEEGIFYPRVREANPRLVDHCTQDHDEMHTMIEQIKMMDESDPQAERMFHRLAEAVLEHIEIEEQQLFPRVRDAQLDLAAIGEEMQAFEVQQIGRRSHKAAAGLRA